MKIVIFSHPDFLNSKSMPQFTSMLKTAFEARGFSVQVWSPRALVYKLVSRFKFAKWGGYIDQYLIFPLWVRKTLKSTSADTLFVFSDQALGPWVPLVQNRPHVLHVHDLTALRCALGDLKQNPLSFTGRVYQRYIRRGFQRGRHFISVSKKTRTDLHEFGAVSPVTSEVVYNGLHFPYHHVGWDEAQDVLHAAGLPTTPEGIILNVGGGQWYKNLLGVIAIYSHYAGQSANPLPLWCVGPAPDKPTRLAIQKVPPAGQIRFFSDLDERTLQALYSSSRVLLFPSIAEGFGWPLVEALACGCPVITTDAPPMNEFTVGAARYVPLLQYGDDIDAWGKRGAAVLTEVVSTNPANSVQMPIRGSDWAVRFDAVKAIDAYLSIYSKVFMQSAR